MSKIKTVKGSYIEDITGQTFNTLTVLELTDKKNNDNRWLWKCQCSCGNIVYVSMHQLRAKKYGTKIVEGMVGYVHMLSFCTTSALVGKLHVHVSCFIFY